MYDKTPYFYGTGRRKSSVARVRLYQGTGKITINDRDIDDYFGLDKARRVLSVTASPELCSSTTPRTSAASSRRQAS